MSSPLIAALLSGTFLAALFNYLMFRRTKEIGAAVDRKTDELKTLMQTRHAWKQESVSKLLGPLHIQFHRTKKAFQRYQGSNTYLESQVLKAGNERILELLQTHAHLIPPELTDDAIALIVHYERWLEEYQALRTDRKPDAPMEPFVFVGPQGYPFPVKAEERFIAKYKELFHQLYAEQAELGSSEE